MDVSEAVETKLTQLAPFFPTGLRYHVAYSTTPFVKISIEEVVKTLIEAIVLVIVIMYLFLQNWRVTLIPAVAVPVVLMGTRSEEHTSELQSLMRISYAVFCLKKKSPPIRT